MVIDMYFFYIYIYTVLRVFECEGEKKGFLILAHSPLSELEGTGFFSEAGSQSSLRPGWTHFLNLGASIQSAPFQSGRDTWCSGPSRMLLPQPRLVTVLWISYVCHWFGFSLLTNPVVSAATGKTHKRDRRITGVTNPLWKTWMDTMTYTYVTRSCICKNNL